MSRKECRDASPCACTITELIESSAATPASPMAMAYSADSSLNSYLCGNPTEVTAKLIAETLASKKRIESLFKYIGIAIRKLVISKIPKMVFLTQGIEKPAEYIDELLDATSKLKLLIKLRASGKDFFKYCGSIGIAYGLPFCTVTGIPSLDFDTFISDP